MRFRVAGLLAAVSLLAAFVLATSGDAEPAGFWVAGDLHVHTTYSHDSWDPVNDDEESEPWTLGHSVENQFAVAASRGLDFLVITDHNDIRSQSDPGFGRYDVLGIQGYENSLSGHAQMLGADEIYDRGDRSPAAINEMADLLRSRGGAFQINHPAGDSVDFPHDSDWGYGYDVRPDSVEVWNIQSLWQPPAFSSNSIDDAIRYWEGWLNAGHKVAATGGSDNHWVSTTGAQGVGQPTTWVYVTELTQDAIIEGILAGRTAISWQPPSMSGPRVFLEADADGDGTFESMTGDTVADGAGVRVRFENVAPGSQYLVYSSEGLAFEGPVLSDEETIQVPGQHSWIRVEVVVPLEDAFGDARMICDEQFGQDTTYCRNRLVRVAMTSALYVDA